MNRRFDGIVSEDTGKEDKNDDEWMTAEADQVKKFIRNIEDNTKTLEKQINSIQTEVNPTVMEKKNKAIMETITQTQEIISKSKTKLDQMQEFSKTMEQSSKTKMRDNMHRSLTKKLIDTGKLKKKFFL